MHDYSVKYHLYKKYTNNEPILTKERELSGNDLYNFGVQR